MVKVCWFDSDKDNRDIIKLSISTLELKNYLCDKYKIQYHVL